MLSFLGLRFCEVIWHEVVSFGLWRKAHKCMHHIIYHSVEQKPMSLEQDSPPLHCRWKLYATPVGKTHVTARKARSAKDSQVQEFCNAMVQWISWRFVSMHMTPYRKTTPKMHLERARSLPGMHLIYRCTLMNAIHDHAWQWMLVQTYANHKTMCMLIMCQHLDGGRSPI